MCGQAVVIHCMNGDTEMGKLSVFDIKWQVNMQYEVQHKNKNP